MVGSARFRTGLFENHKVNLRYNRLEGVDGWTPSYPKTDKFFFDTNIKTKYEIERGPNYKDAKIFEMNFYLDNDEIIHKRTVFVYMDWLGVIGGLRSVLHTLVIGVIFSGFSNFNSMIETLHATNLYQ
jgi:hypothetical protein